MHVTTVKFIVYGDTHEELVDKSKLVLSNFFDIPSSEVESKINFELMVSEQDDSLEMQDEEFIAEVIAKVRNV